MRMNPFRLLTADEMLAQQYQQATRDLVEAEHTAEHMNARVELLRNRVKRLAKAQDGNVYDIRAFKL